MTLHHPHGQIYAYPFVPAVPQRMIELQSAHLQRTGSNLLHYARIRASTARA